MDASQLGPFAYHSGRSLLRAGEGVLESLPAELEALGLRRPLLVAGGAAARSAVAQALRSRLAGRMAGEFNDLPQHSSVATVEALVAQVQAGAADGFIALGGGKTIDTAKTVADGLGLQVAILPTTASTDAPCSALSVLYRPSGEFHCYTFFDKNPTIVLVDTTVVSKAPPRFLAAGMGDAIATNVEARQCMNSTNFGGGLQTEVSSAICQNAQSPETRGLTIAHPDQRSSNAWLNDESFGGSSR